MSFSTTNGHRPKPLKVSKPEPVLPSNTHAEDCFLQSVLLDESVLGGELNLLSRNDFFDLQSRTVFDQFLAMREAGQQIENSLLIARLQNTEHSPGQNQFEFIGGMGFFARLVESTPIASNAAHYCGIIKECSRRRSMIEIHNDALAAAYSGSAGSTELLSQILGRLEQLRPIAKASQRYPLLTCAELDQAYFDLTYLVAGMLVAGQPCVFAGGKKCMKTTLLIVLAISLATGQAFLERFDVDEPVSVLIMSAESGMATIQETARRVCASMELYLSEIQNLYFSDSVPQLGNAEDMGILRQLLTANAIQVLIIDPTYLAMPGADAGNLFIQGQMLRSINEICQSLGVTLILAHHTKKGIADPFAPGELEDVAWAGFQEFCRQWILLSRREKYDPGTGNHKLWLSAGGSAGHSSLWAIDISEGAFDGRTPRHWGVSVIRADEARNAAKETVDAAKDAQKAVRRAKQIEIDSKSIVAVMLRLPEGETRSIIKERAGVNATRAAVAFDELERSGQIVPCDVKKSNRKVAYPGLKLANG